LSDEVVAWLSVWSDVHMICIWCSWCQCHPIICCFIKIKIGLVFLVPAYPGYCGKEAIKWVLFVCLSVSVCLSLTDVNSCSFYLNINIAGLQNHPGKIDCDPGKIMEFCWSKQNRTCLW